MKARQVFENGTTWTDNHARFSMPILLGLANTGRTLTYKGLSEEIVRRYKQPQKNAYQIYNNVLEKVGRSLNLLSSEWEEEIPPITVLIVNGDTNLPSEGVDGFLGRYVSKSTTDHLTESNRVAMIQRATDEVYAYPRWREVAAYFGVEVATPENQPIQLEDPPARLGAESEAHQRLKEHVAAHPELFRRWGEFGKGQIEFRLLSGDEVDVLFENDDHVLAVEVKTADVPVGELTRGIFQCVKYRAVLRAMHDVEGKLTRIDVLLVAPQSLSDSQQQAAKRLQIITMDIKGPVGWS